LILRFAAALALVLGLGAFLAYLHLLGEGPFAGPAERHLRAMKDRATAPDSVTPFGMAEFAALPHRLPVARYAPLERRGVSLEGFVTGMLRAPDADVHLEVEPLAPLPDSLRGLYVTAEITPPWRRGAPGWSYEALAAAFRPDRGMLTAWPGGPARVRVSGWLLYDFQYDVANGLTARDRRTQRLTGWEVHPVTRIETWDDSLARYVEYPR